MAKRLLFLSILFMNYSLTSNAGWLDFMGKAVSSVGNVAKSVGKTAMGGAKCNMMKSQGMMNSPQYYEECVMTGLTPPPMGMGGGMGGGMPLPYGVTPSVGGGAGTSDSTLNDQWTDDPLAGAGSQFANPMMGGGMNPMMGGGMMDGGMMGQPGYAPQQPTSFSGMLGRSLVNNMMGGRRGAPPGGAYGGQPGYGAQPGYGGRPY